jgi:hypothetical protein
MGSRHLPLPELPALLTGGFPSTSRTSCRSRSVNREGSRFGLGAPKAIGRTRGFARRLRPVDADPPPPVPWDAEQTARLAAGLDEECLETSRSLDRRTDDAMAFAIEVEQARFGRR